MKITILGAPHSKKNSRRNFGHISLPSKAYMTFEESALWQIKEQYKGACLKGIVSVTYTFYQKGKMRQDLDNAIASVNDVLQKARVIEDDNQIVEIHAKKFSSVTGWLTEVEIEI